MKCALLVQSQSPPRLVVTSGVYTSVQVTRLYPSSCFFSPSSLSLFPISLTTRKIPVHENPLEHLCAVSPPSLLSPGPCPLWASCHCCCAGCAVLSLWLRDVSPSVQCKATFLFSLNLWGLCWLLCTHSVPLNGHLLHHFYPTLKPRAEREDLPRPALHPFTLW